MRKSPSGGGQLWIGTAGWTVPRDVADLVPGEGTHLQRYARRFNSTEINSSFHRPHRRSTYERWAQSVPDGFRFSVKLPKAITHKARLVDSGELTEEFLTGVEGLGSKLGCLLVQLPPSLELDLSVAASFFEHLRSRYGGRLACEPRHASWFTEEGSALLVAQHVARVAADPPKPEGAGEPGGWPKMRYYRLHGSPRTYYSSYTTEALEELGRRLMVDAEKGLEVWCIFDNTTLGAAAGNALELDALMRKASSFPRKRESSR